MKEVPFGKYYPKGTFLMITIGIDQSISSTGVVVFSDDSMIHHELIQIPPVKGMIEKVRKIKTIAEECVRIVKEHNPEMVYIEEIAYAGMGDAAKDLAGLFYAILVYFEQNGIKYTTVNIKKLKKSATGNGNANKQDMFDSLPDDIKEIFGSVPKTKGRFDLTDAFHMAYNGKHLK